MSNLEETSPLVLITICLLLILFYTILERSMLLITHWLRKHEMKSVEDAVEKLKSEWMLLGLISLILEALKGPISNTNIPLKYANSNLPFPEIMVPLMSEQGINQSRIFMIVLASTQLFFSLLIMALGAAKMCRWKAWEEEAQSISYELAHDPQRFRFVRRHVGTASTKLLWIKCFFRQFFHSVEKVDYFTLRHGFIKADMPTNSNFNFQNYIQRSLEDDFKVVVGISPYRWLVVVILLQADVNGLIYVWIAYLPMIMLLVLGTKLEVILARMALQLEGQTDVTRGGPDVQNNLFWFSKPIYFLNLLHLIMLMNAFELASFLWATVCISSPCQWQFGLKTYYDVSKFSTYTRVVSAVLVQIICSYITFPIYALVRQMGSQYKSSAENQGTRRA